MSHKSVDYKLAAIKDYLKYKNYSETSRRFNCPRTSLMRWVKKYNNTKSISRKKRLNISYKVTKDQVNFALKLVEKNPQISMITLLAKIRTKYSNLDITPQHLGQIIRDNNITRKRTKIRHYPKTRYGKSIDFIKELKEFYKKVSKINLSKIISVDETSIHPQIINNYSRCELGKRCVKKTTNNAVFKKYTLICAINYQGIIGWELYEHGGINSERMVEFIKKYIDGKFKKNVIIMDNGGSHKSSQVKSSISNSKNKLLYSVPYRPKTNAIESFFSQLKHHFDFENKNLNFTNLKIALKKSMRKIKKEHFSNYMKYAYRTPQSKIITNESTRKRKLKNYKN